jgi:collagenase-like PrtC family protease
VQFTISARGKPAAAPIHKFIKDSFSDIPIEQIESFFGFTEPCTLYGGRVFNGAELSRYDLRSLYKLGINLRIPLTNHYATEAEYTSCLPFLEKHYRPRNSVIITNDNLANWIRADFPAYRVEASVIKNINTLAKVEKAYKIYDTVILPLESNKDEEFLLSIPEKERVMLFANAGCAMTCPSKICYTSVSKVNKDGDISLWQCSQSLKPRDMIGMLDFDLEYLQDLGFHRFKLLRSRPGRMTGF